MMSTVITRPVATTAPVRSQKLPFFIDPLSAPIELKASELLMQGSTKRTGASFANECLCCQANPISRQKSEAASIGELQMQTEISIEYSERNLVSLLFRY